MKTRKSIIVLSAIMTCLVIGVVSLFLLMNREETIQIGNKADIDWYTEDGKEFIITTAEELYGVVKLSQYYDFSGQTIKLGADIVVNEGNAEDWAKKAPAKKWFPIDGFAGKFDGQGHTISGIYGYGADTVAGLFSNTKTKANIRDFKLLNSFFKVDGLSPVGSIVSNGCGTIEKVYSDAIITSNGENVGGIVGKANDDGTASAMAKTMKIINCWFDGSITLTTKTGRYGGGIVGLVSGGTLTVSHCLNSADIWSQSKESNGVFVGGLFGALTYANYSGAVILEDSLNVGKVETLKTTATGSIAGSKVSDVTWKITDTYTTEQSNASICTKQSGTTEGGVPQLNTDFVKGTEWYRWTTLDFDTYWAVTEDGTPVLKCFADEVIDVSGLTKGYNLNWYVEGKLEQVLNTKEDLYGFALLSYSKTFEGQNIVLGNDIVVNEGKASDWAKGKNLPKECWIPIGRTLAFQGTFDGKGHTVSGLYGTTTVSFMGLVGWAGNYSELKNISVKNSYFESIEASSAAVGSIAGRLEGKIDTTYSDSIISGTGALLGGIAGYKRSTVESKITNSWFDGTINMVGDKGKYVGGIIGRLIDGTLELDNCLFSGKINIAGKRRTVSVGGFVGVISAGTVTVNNSLNSGEFAVTEAEKVNAVGRVFGQLADAETIHITVNNSYFTNVGYNGDYFYYRQGDKQTIKGGAELKEIKNISGQNGYRTTGLDFSKYWSIVVNEDGTPILKSFAKKSPSVAGLAKTFDKSWYNPDKDTYTLKDKEDLYGFAYLSNSKIDFKGKKIVLANDIQVHTGSAVDWSNDTNTPEDIYNWDGIGKYTAFLGAFDGQGHTISGLYGVTDTANMGLFASVAADGSIQNVRLTNTYFGSTKTGSAAVGSIAGRLEGNIDTAYSDAILSSVGNNTGGIVGYKNDDIDNKITNCWYAGTMKVSGNASGGIIGRMYAGTLNISNCLFSGTVSVGGEKRSASVGGFIGRVAGQLKLDGCLNSGIFEFSEASNMDSTCRVIGQVANEETTKISIKNTYFTNKGKKNTAYWYSAGKLATIECGAELKDEKTIMGYGGFDTTSLDFENAWVVVIDDEATPNINEAGTPVLKKFAQKAPSVAGRQKIFDKSWYDAKKDKYYIEDKEDLYGLAYLSNSKIDFEGKTIVLKQDIPEVNEGTAVDWSNNTNVPEIIYHWEGIGKYTPFYGEFDGQGKTIGGLYGVTTTANIGLFAQVDEKGSVHNLRLTNSYFEANKTGSAGIGSIAGLSEGDIYDIYSDAILKSKGNSNGGIIGYKNEDTKSKMTNCWYAGTMNVSGNASGGIIGRLYAGNMEMTNCLFSGTIYIEGAKSRSSSTGGFVGRADQNVTIKNSLNSGAFELTESEAMSSVGRIIGQINNSKKVNVTLQNICYTDKGFNGTYDWYCAGKLPKITSEYVQVAEEDAKGYLAYFNTGLDFTDSWAIVLDDASTITDDEAGTPILKKFADATPALPQIPENADISWYSYEKDTYKISEAEHLRGVSCLSGYGLTFEGKTIELEKDIVLNKDKGTVKKWEETDFADLESWTPIGTMTTKFAGVFDGKLHSIEGLYVDSDEMGVGLFRSTETGSTIKNLKIKNSYFKTSEAFAGSVVGACGGNLQNVYSSAKVVSTADYSGGLVGQVWNAGEEALSISSCWYDGEMDVYRNTGGIVGVVSLGEVEMSNCLNTAPITYHTGSGNNKWVGGLCGRTLNFETEWSVTASQESANGIIDLNISKCLNTGILSASTKYYVGSIIGYAQRKPVTYDKVYFTTESYSKAAGNNTSSTTSPDGITGYTMAEITVSEGGNSESDVQNKLTGFDFANVWAFGSEGTPELLWVNNLNVDINWYNDSTDVYQIGTAKELYGFAYLCNQGNDFAGKTIELTGKINLNEGKGTVAEWKSKDFEGVKSWTPIGTTTTKFAGVFDGKNYTIEGIYVKSDEMCVGLFRSTAAGSTIMNLKIENSYLKTSAAFAGSIVGVCGGNLQNVYSTAEVVSSTHYAGGLVGQVWNDGVDAISISQCWYNGEMNVYRNTGGIVGVVSKGKVEMSNCLNSGTIAYDTGSGNDKYVGGLCGRTLDFKAEWSTEAGDGSNSTIDLKMSNCLNTGTLSTSTKNYVGSIIGRPQRTPVTYENVYYTNESYAIAVGYKGTQPALPTGITGYSSSQITVSDGGNSASDVQGRLTGFDFTNIWKIGTNGTPELVLQAPVSQ